jgi:hypothetical protein
MQNTTFYRKLEEEHEELKVSEKSLPGNDLKIPDDNVFCFLLIIIIIIIV